MAEKYWKELADEEKSVYNEISYDGTVQQFFTTGIFNTKGTQYSQENFTKNVLFDTTVDLNSINATKGLKFENCYFSSDVVISGESRGKLEFIRCVFEKELIFQTKNTSTLSVDLIDVLVKKQLLLLKGSYTEIKASFKASPVIKLNGGTFKEIDLGYWGHKSAIKDLYINAEKMHGILRVNKTDIKRIHLSGMNKELEIYIENINVNSFTIYRFRNESKFRIQNIGPLKIDDKNSEIVIYDANLNKAEFYETDLSVFDQIIFHDSFLAETILVNIDWPKTIEPYGGQYISEEEKNSLNKKSYYKKKKDTYRQLKFALNKQGDPIGEHFFHGLEMSAYNKTIKTTWKTIGTKLVLSLSKGLSNYGQSLSRPFWALLVGIWILFVVMIYCYSYKNFQISEYININWNVTFDAFAELLRLCNPLHINEVQLNGGLLILDLISRIWSSYMVYNLIRATRRFIK